MSKCNIESVISKYPPSDGREWDCQCARCGSSCDWQDCWDCDDRFYCDCDDDWCCCICHGHGGLWECSSPESWCNANPMKGRDNVPRGQIEWFTFYEVNP